MREMAGQHAQSGTFEGRRWTSNGIWINIGGDRNWRNHNPGNLEDGDFARRHGAIGTDGRFAIFPDYQTGKRALVALLTTETYRALTVGQAIERFAPNFENDASAYTKFIGNSCGISPDALLSSMSLEMLEAVAGAIELFEGGRFGVTHPIGDLDAAEFIDQVRRSLKA
jgi:hypothetical protein